MRLLFRSQGSTLEELQRKFPTATPEECRRFHSVCPREAASKMGDYMKWREKHHLDALEESTDDDTDSTGDSQQPPKDLTPFQKDEMDWEEAVQKALFVSGTIDIVDGEGDISFTPELAPESKKRGFIRRGKRGDPKRSYDYPKTKAVRQCMYAPRLAANPAEPLRDIDGHKILLHIPARIDLSAASNEFYAEAMALYLDSHLDRHDEDTLTLVVDVRPGKNWPNPSALNLLGFIRHVAHALHDLNPHRLHHCVLYPIPRAAFYMWKIISSFLDPTLRELMVLIPGADTASSPTPTRAMYKYMDKETLACIEKARERALLQE